MRMLPTALAAAALCLSSIPAVALAAAGTKELKSDHDFSIKQGEIPGCSTTIEFSDAGKILTVTCDSQQAFEAGIQVSSDDLVKSCDAKNSKFVCTIQER